MPFTALEIESCSVDLLLTKRRRMVREMLAQNPERKLRIAVLGGTTTNELVDFLEVHLLANGFLPVFYQSDYGRFYEDAVHDSEELIRFKPELVFIHTSYMNLASFPPVRCTPEEYDASLQRELSRFRTIWDQLASKLGCLIIQNNFELPPYTALGNMDAVAQGGRTRFVLDLNHAFADAAATNPRLLLQDILTISSRIGHAQWFDWNRWFSYKMPYSSDGVLAIARSMNAIIKAIYGKSRKVLVLDLDNTLWGGVIGDDGADKIHIGRETPLSEGYTAFQEYCLELRQRGVLLAVASKNNDEIAREGFAHPDSILKLEHFSAFKANWSPKHENLIEIAKELNLGLDSFVFVDDNPAERAIVSAQVPVVAVPDVGSDVSQYRAIIDAERYFEPVSLSTEDFERAAMYQAKTEQTAMESKFASYGEYLDSLEMVAEVDAFKPVYLERIAQLTNKTNQFNLTTKRCTMPEMEGYAADPAYVTLYGRLADRFGDNGLVTVVVAKVENEKSHINLWLMSCRVLKRDMELAMLDELAARSSAAGATELIGTYLPTRKNGMVADHFEKLGFTLVNKAPEGVSEWSLDLTNYIPRNQHIKSKSG
jgi:FkbH-like protein